LKRETRRHLLRLFRYTGIMDIWRSVHKKDIGILMLHGTADPRRSSSWTPLRHQYSPEDIDWCFGILRNYYRFISFEEAVAILSGSKPPVDYGLAVTCDDGYRSNVNDALRVFREHGVPITVFVAASPVENRTPFWFDRLDYALQMGCPNDHVFQVGSRPFRFSTQEGRDSLANSYGSFRRLVKKEYKDEKAFLSKIEEVIMHFEGTSGKSLVDIHEGDPWSGLLSWEDMRKAQGKDVSFGSHTMDHYRIDQLEEAALRYQLMESKKRIEEKTGKKCDYLAYPSGAFSAEAMIVARECGYHAAATTVEGINRIGCDLMSLKRVTFPLTSDPAELLAHVSGFSMAISRINKSAIGAGGQ